jgi:DNA repair and recombination protein RAD52
MHGSFRGDSSSVLDPQVSYMETTQATIRKIALLQEKLNKKLGPEFISQRPGPGGNQKLTYAEGWKIINLANDIFGFNGWSSSVVNLNVDFIDFNEESKRYTIGVTAIVRVTLRDGVHHEDVGFGMLENSKSKGTALDKVSIHLAVAHILNSSLYLFNSAKRKLLRTGSNGLSVASVMLSVIVCMTRSMRKRLSR